LETPRAEPGKPLLGAFLGAAVAAFIVVIAQQAALVFAGRFVTFGALGLGIACGALALTEDRRSLAFRGTLTVATALFAFGLTGIPAMNDRGETTGGCIVEASSASSDASNTSSAVRPAQTSSLHPFVLDTRHDLDWSLRTPLPFSGGTVAVSVDVFGFVVPVWVTPLSDSVRRSWEGSEDVGGWLEEARRESGFTISGVYHLKVTLSAPEGSCTVDAYVAARPPNVFSGPILVGSWAGLAAALAIGVRQGGRRARSTDASAGSSAG
jgi:hypothetical protein